MDLLGYCSGHVRGGSGDAPLHRPGKLPDTRNFLDGPFGVLMRLNRQSVGTLVARKHPDRLDALTTPTIR